MLRFVTLDLSFFDKNRVTKCNASVTKYNPVKSIFIYKINLYLTMIYVLTSCKQNFLIYSNLILDTASLCL